MKRLVDLGGTLSAPAASFGVLLLLRFWKRGSAFLGMLALEVGQRGRRAVARLTHGLVLFMLLDAGINRYGVGSRNGIMVL
jgi:hypothetical protein